MHACKINELPCFTLLSLATRDLECTAMKSTFFTRSQNKIKNSHYGAKYCVRKFHTFSNKELHLFDERHVENLNEYRKGGSCLNIQG